MSTDPLSSLIAGKQIGVAGEVHAARATNEVADWVRLRPERSPATPTLRSRCAAK